MAHLVNQPDPVPIPQLFSVPAEVVEGVVEADDGNAAFITQPDGQTIYTDYLVTNRYEKDHHVYMMANASPTAYLGGTASFVQLAAPTVLWVCDWTASRTKYPPVIPTPVPYNPDWVLLDEHMEPAMVGLAPDGVTPVYRISGTYVYGRKRPSDQLNLDVNYPRPPWMQDVFSRTMPNEFLGTFIKDTNQ